MNKSLLIIGAAGLDIYGEFMGYLECGENWN